MVKLAVVLAAALTLAACSGAGPSLYTDHVYRSAVADYSPIYIKRSDPRYQPALLDGGY